MLRGAWNDAPQLSFVHNLECTALISQSISLVFRTHAYLTKRRGLIHMCELVHSFQRSVITSNSRADIVHCYYSIMNESKREAFLFQLVRD